MFRLVCAVAPLLLASLSVPATAEAKERKSEKAAKTCEPEKRKKRNSMFGSVLGSIAGTALGNLGVPSGIAGVSLPVGSLLTDAIMSRLDCKEQVQAATATNEAVRGGTVGSSSSWTSETREDVSGTSTVAAVQTADNGTSCMTVDDVIIVEGEETRVSKRMCRAPGASGYSVAV